jgi:hypothetical protein
MVVTLRVFITGDRVATGHSRKSLFAGVARNLALSPFDHTRG